MLCNPGLGERGVDVVSVVTAEATATLCNPGLGERGAEVCHPRVLEDGPGTRVTTTRPKALAAGALAVALGKPGDVVGTTWPSAGPGHVWSGTH